VGDGALVGVGVAVAVLVAVGVGVVVEVGVGLEVGVVVAVADGSAVGDGGGAGTDAPETALVPKAPRADTDAAVALTRLWLAVFGDAPTAVSAAPSAPATSTQHAMIQRADCDLTLQNSARLRQTPTNPGILSDSRGSTYGGSESSERRS
jgi:hypothetical protein